MGTLAIAAEVHMNQELLLSSARGRGKKKKSFQKGAMMKMNIINSNSNNSHNYDYKALELKEIRESRKKWLWKGQYSINYLVKSDSINNDNATARPPLLLVHGFGASIPHWRRNIATLAENYSVYAIDLLGFGASDKPKDFSYTMEAWSQLILDFMDEVIQKPTVLIGNSGGSLACVIAASENGWRAGAIKLCWWDEQQGQELMPRISVPVLVLWGDKDPFTHLDGSVGRYFPSLPSQLSNVKLSVLEGVGHCPHDDKPSLVHHYLLPWLSDFVVS